MGFGLNGEFSPVSLFDAVGHRNEQRERSDADCNGDDQSDRHPLDRTLVGTEWTEHEQCGRGPVFERSDERDRRFKYWKVTSATVIRYALVLVLATAIVGTAVTAADQVATTRGEQAIAAGIQTVESAASSLYDLEEPADGPGPRRIVTVEMHDRGPLRAEPAQVKFERVDGATRVTYRVDGGVTQKQVISVPIRHADGGPVELTNWSGSVRLVLRLTVEDGERVVTVEPYN